MESIIEWAQQFNKEKRNKPSTSLQTELFERISKELEKETPAFGDCVIVLNRFDRKVIEPFYREYYARFSTEQQRQWDDAFLEWVENTKPPRNAALRLIPIIRIRLEYMEDVIGLERELRWLALHIGDERTVSEIKRLKSKVDSEVLRKLLKLDLSEWRSGRAGIEKIFGILFQNSTDEATAKAYEDFLRRIGKPTAHEEPAPQPIGDAPEPNQSEGEDCSTADSETALPRETHEKGVLPSSDMPEAVSPPIEKEVGEFTTANGVALAEALLMWVQDRNERCISQNRQIADLQASHQKLQGHIAELENEMAVLRETLSETQHALSEREHELKAAHERIKTVEQKESEARDTIGLIQQMSNNSVRQELDGYKHTLSSELKKTAVDLKMDVSDFSNAEKADVYKALLEEMMDTLAHHGIVIGEN